MLLKFLLGSVGLLVTVSLVSLLWPKFTVKPKPALLEEVGETVTATPVGQALAEVLGVSSAPAAPLNLQEVATGVVNSVVTTVERRITETVTTQTINQLIKQIEKLPQEQQTQIKESICTGP